MTPRVMWVRRKERLEERSECVRPVPYPPVTRRASRGRREPLTGPHGRGAGQTCRLHLGIQRLGSRVSSSLRKERDTCAQGAPSPSSERLPLGLWAPLELDTQCWANAGLFQGKD